MAPAAQIIHTYRTHSTESLSNRITHTWSFIRRKKRNIFRRYSNDLTHFSCCSLIPFKNNSHSFTLLCAATVDIIVSDSSLRQVKHIISMLCCFFFLFFCSSISIEKNCSERELSAKRNETKGRQREKKEKKILTNLCV